MKIRVGSLRAAGVCVLITLAGTACGSTEPSSAPQVTTSPTKTMTSSPTATEPTTTTSASAPVGTTRTLHLKDADGYEATMTFTVGAPQPLAPDDLAKSCDSALGLEYYTEVVYKGGGTILFRTQPLTATLTPIPVNGFTWPLDRVVPVATSYGTSGEACNGFETKLTPGSPLNRSYLYTTQVTPNKPQGDWATKKPWTDLTITVADVVPQSCTEAGGQFRGNGDCDFSGLAPA
jgi:hypothetical protein